MRLVPGLRFFFPSSEGKRAPGRSRGSARPRYYRPRLDYLEDRVVPSASPILPAPQVGAALAPSVAHHTATAVPLSITGVTAQNGQLVAQGLLGNQPFTAPLTLTSSSTTGTPILDLDLNAIHLNVLGLKVDTSNICLDITAQPGSGGLGGLLSSIATSLNGGTPLSTVLSTLTPAQTSQLTSGLTSLLNGALSQVTSTSATPSVVNNILTLSVGPLDLNLLGLNVHLDNCANGPVTVSVSAQPGAGNLLGNLISRIGHLLDTPASPSAIAAHLAQLGRDILHLTA